MNKLWLIIKREYLSRVTKKTFILVTILTPLGIALIGFLSGYLMKSSMKTEKNVALIDKAQIVDQEVLKNSGSTLTFDLQDGDLRELKDSYTDSGYDVLVHVPAPEDLSEKDLKASFYSKEKLSITTVERIESQLSKAIRSHKVDQSGIDREVYNNLKTNVILENALVSEEGEGDSSSRMSIAIATGLSYLMGFLMYMVIFIYGGFVMRSVMEEKINRIVEVMISTVKPFYLMLGKIIGVGLVGLTQLGIWLILIPIIAIVMSQFFGVDTAATAQSQEVMDQLKASGNGNIINEFLTELYSMNWSLIIPVFILFFFGGYFLYSSLFAAVGSAIGDDVGEGQQMMLPITIPVILAFVMIPSVFNDPDGKIAVFGSIFPLLSPIIMPARLPFDPPMWQVILSILVLLATVVFFAWMAGRIYRVGILMYGKKVSFKELGKWLFYK